MYVLTAAKDRPLGLWALDDTSPYQDYSGYNRSATGPNNFAAALVNGAAWSNVFSNASQATFTSPVFDLNRKSFSLEAWVYPFFEDVAEISVLSHTGEYDGLVIDDTKVAFVTKYDTTGEARTEYQFLRPQAMHIVGVHTEAQNMLFVNGELVSTVDITEEQQLDSFVATGNLLAGQSTGTQKVAVNGVALYPIALSNEQILGHFQAGRDVPLAQDTASAFDGLLVSLSKTEASVFLDQTWDTDEEWRGGIFTNMDIEVDRMFPASDQDGVSQPGEWLSSFDLSFSGADSIYGATIEWEAEGAAVEYSVDDGGTWTPAAQGQNVVTPGFDPLNRTVIDTNEFTNPSAEVDTTSVTTALPGTEQILERSDEQAYDGEWSFKVSALAANTRDYFRINHMGLNLGAGQTRTFKLHCYIPSTNEETTHATVLFRDDVAGATYHTQMITIPIVYDEWFTLEYEHTVPVTRTLTRVYWNIFQGAAIPEGNVAYFDGWHTTEGAYFDGSSGQDEEDHVFHWTGAEHASTSTKSTIEPVDLELRVSFPGGITDDLSYIKSLTVTGFLDGALPATNNRTVVAAGDASIGVAAEPIEYDERNGVQLNGGSLTIGPDDSDEPTDPRTIELWIKRIASTPITPTSGRTIYINGKPTPGALTDLVIGEWSLVHIVYASAVTGNIVISGDAIVGQVVLYEDALTTAQIADIYKSYTGRPKLSVTSSGTIGVLTPPSPVSIYAHEWAIAGGDG